MSEFVGRTGARRVYSYPERPRGSDLQLLARNFASGPKIATAVAANPGTVLPWNTIDAGTEAWSALTTYQTGDLVFFGNVEYISRVDDNLNNQPDVSPADWELSPTVPITPRSTGTVLITCNIVVSQSSGAPILFNAFIQVDGTDVPVPVVPGVTAETGQVTSLTVTAEAQMSVGTTHYIGVRVQGEALLILADTSTIDVREVIAATG